MWQVESLGLLMLKLGLLLETVNILLLRAKDENSLYAVIAFSVHEYSRYSKCSMYIIT